MVSSVKHGQEQCSDTQKMKPRYRTIGYLPLGTSQVTMLHLNWEYDSAQFRTFLCSTSTGNCSSYALQMLMRSLMNREESYLFLAIAFLWKNMICPYFKIIANTAIMISTLYLLFQSFNCLYGRRKGKEML